MEALIVVDTQNDFTSGGALAVDDGDAVIGPVNRLPAEAPFGIATRDWHPRDHGSFVVNAVDGCVKDTALDAKRAGFEVVVHREGTRQVDVDAGDGERVDAGVRVVD